MKYYAIYFIIIILAIYLALCMAENLKSELEKSQLEQKAQIEAILNQ
jgi:large-conductance mechanosensitive channel